MPEKQEDKTWVTNGVIALTKLLLLVFNMVLVVAGIAMLVIGMLAKTRLKAYVQISGEFMKMMPYVLLLLGLLMLVVGFLGCCCVLRDQICLLYCYGIVLVLLCLGELLFGIYGFTSKEQLKTGFNESLGKALSSYGIEMPKSKALDGLQWNLHCCGRYNYLDWFSTPWQKTLEDMNITNAVPQSCCEKTTFASCQPTFLPGNMTEEALTISKKGCYVLVANFAEENLALLGGIAVGLAGYQMIGAVLSCVLAKYLRKKYKYEEIPQDENKKK